MSAKLVLGIAALFAIVFLVIQPGKKSDFELFAENFSPIENKISFTPTSDNISRGMKECKIENLELYNEKECELVKLALQEYNEKSYVEATKYFNSLRTEVKQKNPIIVFYLANAQLQSGQVLEAIDNLSYLSQYPGDISKEEINYYLALAYLKNGKRENAKDLLEVICGKNSKYSDKSCEILMKLRKFSL
jgi:outer membrane protein assembly factor BamD (BamD/ComL family)